MKAHTSKPSSKPEALNSRFTHTLFAALYGALAFWLAIYAIDTASLLSYAFAFVAFVLGLRQVYQAVKGSR